MTSPGDAWKMVEKNQGLVVKVLQDQFGWIMDRARTGAMDWEDYFSAGVYGLYRAALKFDPARGCTFSTYAFHWIRQAISRAFRTCGFRSVKVPCWAFDRLSKLQRKHKDRLGSWITKNGSREIKAAQNALSDCVYLDEDFTTKEGHEHSYDEAILLCPDGKAKAKIQDEDKMRILLAALRELAPREREALMRFFSFNRDLGAVSTFSIAKSMKIKKESVCREKRRALKKLRVIFEKQGITSTDMLGEL